MGRFSKSFDRTADIALGSLWSTYGCIESEAEWTPFTEASKPPLLTDQIRGQLHGGSEITDGTARRHG